MPCFPLENILHFHSTRNSHVNKLCRTTHSNAATYRKKHIFCCCIIFRGIFMIRTLWPSNALLFLTPHSCPFYFFARPFVGHSAGYNDCFLLHMLPFHFVPAAPPALVLAACCLPVCYFFAHTSILAVCSFRLLDDNILLFRLSCGAK